jgi:hypothetical protein
MAHDWEETPPTQLLGDFGRRCKNCGAEQHVARDYWWGRIVATKWRPKAGRCTGTPADRLLRRTAETTEGTIVLREARHLAHAHPDWTDGQCIRAAYWGAPGDPWLKLTR